MTLNIQQFYKQFKKEYTFLYENDNVAGYEEAVTAFDEMCKSNASFRKFVSEFCKYTCDFISSDREAAAFMFALETME